MRELQKSIY